MNLFFLIIPSRDLYGERRCPSGISCPHETTPTLFHQFQNALYDENLRKAQQIFDLIERQYRTGDPLLHFARAQLSFYEGDYAKAFSILSFLSGPEESSMIQEFRQLVERTLNRTQGMKTIRDSLVEVRVVPGPDELLVPFVIDTVRKAYEVFKEELRIELKPPDLPIRIEIYSSSEDFVAVSTLSQREVETSGTIALTKFHRIMIITPRVLVRGYRWQDTLAHELVHYMLLCKGGNPIPLWLHEGVAKYWERRWRDPTTSLTPVQETILDQARRRKTWVPFSRMMPSLAKLRSGYETALAFSELAFWVHRFVEKHGIKGIADLLDRFSQGEKEGYAALGGSIDTLWERFLSDIHRVRLNPLHEYRFIPIVLGDQGKASEDSENMGQFPGVERYLRLGDLLKDEGRWMAAISEYTQAERLIGAETITLALKKAEAYIIGGRYSLAQEALERAARRDPDRSTVFYLLGRIALFRGRYEEAQQFVEEAFSITPFHQGVLETLVEVARLRKDESRLRIYQKALETYLASR